jgi:two-component system, response regulator PdtaR
MGATRILIAEDETIIRLDLARLLVAAGFDVCAEARNGVEAVELAAATAPDVVILDVKMPQLDGLEAAKRILAARPLPVLLLTAFGDAELVARAADVGAFAYLMKPFREQDLVPAIRTAQARHAELADLRLEANSLREALAARKAIERAKGILMAKDGITEAEAFDRLRRASQRSGRPMLVIAEALAATLADT